MHDLSLTQQLKRRALELGFDVVGIAPAGPATQTAALRRWLARSYHGRMEYLARADAVAARADLHQRLPAARSLIVLGISHPAWALPAELALDPARGRIASYAWGVDYHDLLKPRLFALDRWLRAQSGRATLGKVSVDSAPVLERDWAQQAGLGFIGKNTCLIHPRLGSWLLLATLLVPEALDPDDPAALTTPLAAVAPIALHADLPLDRELASPPAPRAPAWQFASGDRGGCGGCVRCLVDCPTQAFASPFLLDARRCISYLTIELKGRIPEELRPLIGNRIYGCDDCQLRCPWNRDAPRTKEKDFAPRHGLDAATLVDLFAWSKSVFAERLAGSPIHRIGHERWLRNIAVALGNAPTTSDVIAALASRHKDESPMVREHVAWALRRHDPTADRDQSSL